MRVCEGFCVVSWLEYIVDSLGNMCVECGRVDIGECELGIQILRAGWEEVMHIKNLNVI